MAVGRIFETHPNSFHAKVPPLPRASLGRPNSDAATPPITALGEPSGTGTRPSGSTKLPARAPCPPLQLSRAYYSVAFAKVYDTKTPVTAADTLNDQVLPFLEEQDI